LFLQKYLSFIFKKVVNMFPILKVEFNKIVSVMFIIILSFCLFGLLTYNTEQKIMVESIMSFGSSIYFGIDFTFLQSLNVLWIFVIIYIQFSNENRDFLFSLPYKKNEILFCKILCGILSYTVAFLIYAVALYFLYNKYKFAAIDINDILGEENGVKQIKLYITLFIQWLSFTAFYFVSLFFAVIFKSKANIVINFIFVFTPSIILNIIRAIYARDYVSFDRLNFLSPYYAFEQYTEYSSVNYVYVNYYGYINNLYIIFLVIVIAVFAFLSFLFYKRNSSKVSKILFKSGVIIWSAIITFYLSQQIINSVAVVFILMAIVVICTFKIYNKIVLGVKK